MESGKYRQLSGQNLPSFLNSRAGWGKLFELKRSPFPHVHQIEPTNACPYHCIMCPRGKKMKRPVGYMDFRIFTRIADEIFTYPDEIRQKEIELFHFGESLLHPEIAGMNEYAASLGLKTVLSVNAPELDGSVAEKLIKGKASRIIVSLDGFDAESFFRIRGRKIDFQKAIDNILNASSLIRSLDSSTKLSVRMIEMTVNTAEVENFKNFWKEKNIETEIRRFFPWGEKDMKELGEYDKYPPFMPCPFPWQYVVIHWNGDVVACCRDYNAENKLGNVKDTSLQEIWNGKDYSVFRENMVSGMFNNSICSPCLNLYYTES